MAPQALQSRDLGRGLGGRGRTSVGVGEYQRVLFGEPAGIRLRMPLSERNLERIFPASQLRAARLFEFGESPGLHLSRAVEEEVSQNELVIQMNRAPVHAAGQELALKQTLQGPAGFLVMEADRGDDRDQERAVLRSGRHADLDRAPFGRTENPTDRIAEKTEIEGKQTLDRENVEGIDRGLVTMRPGLCVRASFEGCPTSPASDRDLGSSSPHCLVREYPYEEAIAHDAGVVGKPGNPDAVETSGAVESRFLRRLQVRNQWGGPVGRGF